ncbi:hypothetical protein [Marinobacter sp. DY40_1A1]|uniref:hypothetical protein n=1 Tax=Marinobacter sp. DY40_1A1 TaxID=2583229 RepID=UPI0019087046|nr:hypothetical protein [Marinobacter sp. DY40_1A1]MBK1887770.1 hypothetical protein [Marinobacter sp. DY40_1A1]
MKNLNSLVFMVILVVSGCATPPEVKQLSLQQMEYFDSAIEAVSAQSEALIMATEVIVKNAKLGIENRERESKASMENLAVNIIPTLTDKKKKEAALKMLSEVEETVKVAEKSRSNLDKDLDKVRNKSDELTQYLRKMKEVHLAIDAYVQSEKAGEKVVSDMLKYPSVNDLVTKANNLIPKIKQGSQDLQSLISGMQ